MTLAGRLVHRFARSRRLILAVAAVAGLGVALATGPGSSEREARVIADAYASGAPIRVAADAAPTPPAAQASPDAAAPAAPAGKSRPAVDAEITIGERGVAIRKRGDFEEPHVVVGDMEFDSFEEFVTKAPWLAALVFMVTALAFLTPVLIIVLIIWYKMRSNRLRNETMLKLAERGVVPPAEAISAVGNPGAPPLEALPATAPLYERARQLRRRAAWSDLRKGIVMLGIGLGLVFWSMLDEGTANGFGLVLLFVGIGYIVLWYFEERQVAGAQDRGGGTTGGA